MLKDRDVTLTIEFVGRAEKRVLMSALASYMRACTDTAKTDGAAEVDLQRAELMFDRIAKMDAHP